MVLHAEFVTAKRALGYALFEYVDLPLLTIVFPVLRTHIFTSSIEDCNPKYIHIFSSEQKKLLVTWRIFSYTLVATCAVKYCSLLLSMTMRWNQDTSTVEAAYYDHFWTRAF
jgi:hypothetical protein